MTDSHAIADLRQVRYKTLAEFAADAQHLSEISVRTLGNWSYGQILQYLATTMNCAFDGFGYRASWFARWGIAPFVKNSLLTKAMPLGFQFPRRAAGLLPAEIAVPDALENLQRALKRFAVELPRARHPLLGNLAAQEWVSLALRHAELQMRFVVPATT